jgi:hypothetical protein
MYVYTREIRGEGLGDVFSDRMYGEWPTMAGREAEEGEFDLSGGWPAEGIGDVFSDRVHGEWPRLRGYEVTEVIEEE